MAGSHAALVVGNERVEAMVVVAPVSIARNFAITKTLAETRSNAESTEAP